jgi:hypothetical protein
MPRDRPNFPVRRASVAGDDDDRAPERDDDDTPETPLDEPPPPRVEDPPSEPDPKGPYVVSARPHGNNDGGLT